MRKMLLASAVFIGLTGLAFAKPGFSFSATNVGGGVTLGAQSGSFEGSVGNGMAANATTGAASANISSRTSDGQYTGYGNVTTWDTTAGASTGWAAQDAASQAVGGASTSGRVFNMNVGNNFRY